MRQARASTVVFAVLCALAATDAAAAAAPKPTVAAGFTIAKLAAAPAASQSCDDLGFLDGNLYMGCQNATLSGGGGGTSTLVEVSPAGGVVRTWAIKDKIDGLAGNPLTHQVIVTLNEDGNTHLATVTPSAAAGKQITFYTFSPGPADPATPVALRTGGGTDNVSVDAAGHVILTASHARLKTGTAVFVAQLIPPAAAGGMGTVKLSPTFADNATAANGNTGQGTVKLGLGDVDSGAIVPRSSPRFGGGYVIDDQTALTLVFAQNLFRGTGVTALKTPYGLDDITWVTSSGGTLYVVDDGGTTTKGTSAIYKVTGPFTPNMVLAANDSLSDQVSTVNLQTGGLTPFIRHLTTTKGLVYLNPGATQTALPLNGAPMRSSSSATPPASTSTPTKAKSSSSNTGLIVTIVIAGLAVLGGGFALLRRRGSAG